MLETVSPNRCCPESFLRATAIMQSAETFTPVCCNFKNSGRFFTRRAAPKSCFTGTSLLVRAHDETLASLRHPLFQNAAAGFGRVALPESVRTVPLHFGGLVRRLTLGHRAAASTRFCPVVQRVFGCARAADFVCWLHSPSARFGPLLRDQNPILLSLWKVKPQGVRNPVGSVKKRGFSTAAGGCEVLRGRGF